jgi:hypothetical protein
LEEIKLSDDKHILELKRKIEDLKNRLPAHSIPPGMIAELDELEEQLEEALKNQEEDLEQRSEN